MKIIYPTESFKTSMTSCVANKELIFNSFISPCLCCSIETCPRLPWGHHGSLEELLCSPQSRILSLHVSWISSGRRHLFPSSLFLKCPKEDLIYRHRSEQISQVLLQVESCPLCIKKSKNKLRESAL